MRRADNADKHARFKLYIYHDQDQHPDIYEDKYADLYSDIKRHYDIHGDSHGNIEPDTDGYGNMDGDADCDAFRDCDAGKFSNLHADPYADIYRYAIIYNNPHRNPDWRLPHPGDSRCFAQSGADCEAASRGVDRLRRVRETENTRKIRLFRARSR